MLKMLKINKKKVESGEKIILTSFWGWAAPKSWSKYTSGTKHFEEYINGTNVLKGLEPHH